VGIEISVELTIGFAFDGRNALRCFWRDRGQNKGWRGIYVTETNCAPLKMCRVLVRPEPKHAGTGENLGKSFGISLPIPYLPTDAPC